MAAAGPISGGGSGDMDEAVVLYVDGGLEGEARVAFEERLARSPELRADVKRARVLRGLLAGLPRRPAELPEFDVLLERLEAEPSPGLRAALGLLRRIPAPAGVFAPIIAEMRRDRRVVQVLRASRFARWPLVASLAAAAVLVLSSVGLRLGALSRPAERSPKHPLLANVQFTFEKTCFQPGVHTSGQEEHRSYVPRPVRSPADTEPGGPR